MSALGFLVPIALGLGLVFAFLFLWSLRGGQWEELDDVARRVVEDDHPEPPSDIPTGDLRHPTGGAQPLAGGALRGGGAPPSPQLPR